MRPACRPPFRRTLCCLLVAVALSAVLVAPAAAQEVLAGFDLFETDPGAEFDFGPTPIPADFFGPGSDPFAGLVGLDGKPLGSSPACPDDNLGNVDTIVRRLGDANVPNFPSSDMIAIEIVELSLVSIDPVVVTFNGGQNPELWDVGVELSQSPQPLGQMTINRMDANGGIFGANLPVLPKFTFTRQSDLQVRVLDFGVEGLPPVNLGTGGVPWENWNPPQNSCTSNWCPSPGVPFTLAGPNAVHGVRAICPLDAIPTVSTWIAVALVMMLIATGAMWIRRRARVV